MASEAGAQVPADEAPHFRETLKSSKAKAAGQQVYATLEPASGERFAVRLDLRGPAVPAYDITEDVLKEINKDRPAGAAIAPVPAAKGPAAGGSTPPPVSVPGLTPKK